VNFYINVWMVLFKAAASFGLLKAVGYLGPAWGSVLTSYVGSAVYLVIVMRMLHTGPLKLIPVGPIFRTAVAAAICAFAVHTLGLVRHGGFRGLIELGVSGLIFGALYLILARLTRAIRDEDLGLVKKWLATVAPWAFRR
jgi:hypothetical protein